MNCFDFDLTETQWSLLKTLEQGPLSPKEIAGLSGTSIANASQQLKFLEAKGYLKKIKQKGVFARQNRDARVLYGLLKPKFWLTSIGKNRVDCVSIKDNFLVNLLLCDIKDTLPVAKFLLSREDLFSKFDCLFFLHSLNNEFHFLVVSDDLDFFRNGNHSFLVSFQNKDFVVKFWSHSFLELNNGLTNHEAYFVDLVNKAKLVVCEREDIKSLFRGFRNE